MGLDVNQNCSRYTEDRLDQICDRLRNDFDNRKLVPGSYRSFNRDLYDYVFEEGDTLEGPEAKFMFAIPTAEMLNVLNK